MNLNVMNLLVGKMLAEGQGLSEQRSFQLGLIAGMMPGFQGVLVTAMIAQREAPTPAPPIDPKLAAQQSEALKKAIDAALTTGGPTQTGTRVP